MTINLLFSEFLAPGAKAEINIDMKTMDATKNAMKHASRYTYEEAAEHVFTLLLKRDCYPRFIGSDYFKALTSNSINPLNQKKRFPFPTFTKKKASVQPAQQGAAAASSSNPSEISAVSVFLNRRHKF